MKKLNLKIEDMNLESFTLPACEEGGTVVGAEARSIQVTCGYSCLPDSTCPAVCCFCG